MPLEEKRELLGLQWPFGGFSNDVSVAEDCLELAEGEVERAQLVEDVPA